MMKEKLIYIGAGAGLVLFAIYGLLPGSFLGGIMGLNLTGLLFGYPVTSDLIPRMIVALSMLIGVMVSGLIFLIGGTMIGWLVGTAIDAVTKARKRSVSAEHSKKV
jgi:hypothetical protein